MNIFVLDRDPYRAAVAQCDKHVVKMPLETAQVMSTIVGGPYRPTHARHPCTVWAGDSFGNFYWLYLHGMALCTEYTRRYGRVHKSQAVIEQCMTIACDSHEFAKSEQTEFVQCMPDEYKHSDPVIAYRAYYKYGKRDILSYKVTPPAWLGELA